MGVWRPKLRLEVLGPSSTSLGFHSFKCTLLDFFSFPSRCGQKKVEGGADMLMGVAVKVGVGDGREEGKGAVGDQGREVCLPSWVHLPLGETGETVVTFEGRCTS